VKPLPVKTQKAILRACLRHWQRACNSPRICKFLFCRNRYFTNEKISAAVHALLLTAGDWSKAKTDIKNVLVVDYDKLFTWAEKVQGGAL
jgi:hypothetical protein